MLGARSILRHMSVLLGKFMGEASSVRLSLIYFTAFIALLAWGYHGMPTAMLATTKERWPLVSSSQLGTAVV